jgi:hypothetical protein
MGPDGKLERSRERGELEKKLVALDLTVPWISWAERAVLACLDVKRRCNEASGKPHK